MKKILIVVWVIIMSSVFIALASAQNLNVEGILISKKETLVIVNGEILKIGDTINGAKIIEVGNDYVKFQTEEKIFITKIPEDKGNPNYQSPFDNKDLNDYKLKVLILAMTKAGYDCGQEDKERGLSEDPTRYANIISEQLPNLYANKPSGMADKEIYTAVLLGYTRGYKLGYNHLPKDW